MKKMISILAISLVTVLAAASVSIAATKHDAALARWERTSETRDNMGGEFRIKITPYTSEYIDLLVQSEAEKNLWTASEMEDYKYNLLRTIRIDEYFAFYIKIDNFGPTAYMNPFDEMVFAWIGEKKYKPSDYDRRFNMQLQGSVEGLVFFPRYDEKSGKSLFEKPMSLRFVVNSAASPVLNGKDIRITWDIGPETGTSGGTAADRMEVDRLLRRVERLTNERNDLASQLESKEREISEIMDRINELQGRR